MIIFCLNFILLLCHHTRQQKVDTHNTKYFIVKMVIKKSPSSQVWCSSSSSKCRGWQCDRKTGRCFVLKCTISLTNFCFWTKDDSEYHWISFALWGYSLENALEVPHFETMYPFSHSSVEKKMSLFIVSIVNLLL